jgi:hypothetical protein
MGLVIDEASKDRLQRRGHDDIDIQIKRRPVACTDRMGDQKNASPD